MPMRILSLFWEHCSSLLSFWSLIWKSRLILQKLRLNISLGWWETQPHLIFNWIANQITPITVTMALWLATNDIITTESKTHHKLMTECCPISQLFGSPWQHALEADCVLSFSHPSDHSKTPKPTLAQTHECAFIVSANNFTFPARILKRPDQRHTWWTL